MKLMIAAAVLAASQAQAAVYTLDYVSAPLEKGEDWYPWYHDPPYTYTPDTDEEIAEADAALAALPQFTEARYRIVINEASLASGKLGSELSMSCILWYQPPQCIGDDEGLLDGSITGESPVNGDFISIRLSLDAQKNVTSFYLLDDYGGWGGGTLDEGIPFPFLRFPSIFEVPSGGILQTSYSTTGFGTWTVTATPIPLPASWGLLLTALVGVGVYQRQKRRATVSRGL